MKLRVPPTLAAAACVGALVLPGCGSDEKGEPIPAIQARDLKSLLAEAERRLEKGGGACGDIPETERAVNDTLGQIPSEVDQDVRDALRKSFERLFELTSQECDEEKGQETETQTEAAPPPPETTPTETKEEKKPKKDPGGGNGGGGDNGGGDAGGGASPPAGGEGGGALVPEGVAIGPGGER